MRESHMREPQKNRLSELYVQLDNLCEEHNKALGELEELAEKFTETKVARDSLNHKLEDLEDDMHLHWSIVAEIKDKIWSYEDRIEDLLAEMGEM